MTLTDCPVIPEGQACISQSIFTVYPHIVGETQRYQVPPVKMMTRTAKEIRIVTVLIGIFSGTLVYYLGLTDTYNCI